MVITVRYMTSRQRATWKIQSSPSLSPLHICLVPPGAVPAKEQWHHSYQQMDSCRCAEAWGKQRRQLCAISMSPTTIPLLFLDMPGFQGFSATFNLPTYHHASGRLGSDSFPYQPKPPFSLHFFNSSSMYIVSNA